ncbi:MAG: glycosyltransferase family protein, partial [Burkholderiaceae bacterium]|nr:glycosyltransferase family protein [Burkholderiaceae bacterium]
QLQEAAASYRVAISLQPTYWEAHAHLGAALKDLGEFDNALAALREAIRLRPRVDWLHLRLGNTLKECWRLDEALDAYRAALALNPAYVECYNNAGSVLVELAHFDEAAAAFQQALTHDARSQAARYNLALLPLRLGNYERGWPLYEARSFIVEQHRLACRPRWTGQLLEGSTIFLHAEQGLGDTIQFSRFAPLLAEKGARVILEVPRKMLRLFRNLEGVTHLIAQGDEVPPFDFHCPLMSVPCGLGTTLDTVPASSSYLTCEEERRLHWRNKLGTHGFKIGITWQGNPKSPSERGRSAPLAQFARLADIPGVRLISLQKINGMEQLDQLPAYSKIETLGSEFDAGPDAFVDTAAVMMELDLVVTVCTSIAHLAGALGRPTWLALQAVPYWLWMQDRSDTPWYPSFRLFRQRERGAWPQVFDDMEQALRHHLVPNSLSPASPKPGTI